MTWITDTEAQQFQGYDKKGKPRSLKGRRKDATAPAVLDVSEAVRTAAEIACKEQREFYVGHDGGYMSLIHSKNWSVNENSCWEIVERVWRSGLVPDYLEKEALNFYMNREVKSEEIHSVNEAEQCLEKETQLLENEYGRAHRS